MESREPPTPPRPRALGARGGTSLHQSKPHCVGGIPSPAGGSRPQWGGMPTATGGGSQPQWGISAPTWGSRPPRPVGLRAGGAAAHTRRGVGLTRCVVEDGGGRRATDTDRRTEPRACCSGRGGGGGGSGQVLEGVQVEGGVEQPLQLRQVRLLVAGGGGGCGLPARIPAGRRRSGVAGTALTAELPHGDPQLGSYHTGLARLMVVRRRGLT